MEEVAGVAATGVRPAAPVIGSPIPAKLHANTAGRLRVFISYSRDDLDFADQLDAALDLYGFDCTIDRQGISGGEDWKSKLGNLIRDSDTVVFVVSPSSARSEICGWEVEEAVKLGKRIIPVCSRSLEGCDPPQRLQNLNYIFFYPEPKVPSSGFGTGLTRLVTALSTDLDWLREHTRLLQRAKEWEDGGKPANRLLSGADIAAAKAWAARRPKDAPEPTALHLDFIRASEHEEDARSSAQRQQLEVMAAAQEERARALKQAEEALKNAAEAQRRRARVRNVAFVTVTAVAVLAGWQWRRAEEQRSQAEGILDAANIIIVKMIDIDKSKLDDETSGAIAEVFKRGAELGNAAAISNLGFAYHNGVGVKQDYARAQELYRAAAQLGYPLAMSNLGVLFQNGLGVTQDYAKAREWFEMAADRNDTGAMLNIGLLYANGQSVAQDYAKAREWYEKAAAKDNAGAMNNLGWMYQNSQGVAQDYAKAHEWYEKAAAKDNATAMLNLGVLYDNGRGVAPDYAKAREWYEKAGARDDAGAMLNIGLMYASGENVAQDYSKAREWYEKAAAKGEPSAMNNLGWMYHNSQGVAQDYAKAREWYEKAAAKQSMIAMQNLGVLYDNGQGVEKDYAKAREWFEKAGAKDDPGVMLSIGLLYANGQHVAQDFTKAREWYEKAAAKDNAGAMTNLGLLYADGQGVTQDYAKARELYEKAADKGEAVAMNDLGWMYQRSQGVAQDYAKAREWYEKAAAKNNADAKLNLERLPIDEAVAAGRYAEALERQAARAAKSEADETKTNGRPGDRTADEILQHSWVALLARDFAQALAAAEHANSLSLGSLQIETNRAHALMFLDRGAEAKALYLAHKGVPLPGGGDIRWEQGIAEDFAKFRKAGLTHPMMKEVEHELAAGN